MIEGHGFRVSCSDFENVVKRCCVHNGGRNGVTFLDLWWAEFHAGKELREKMAEFLGFAVPVVINTATRCAFQFHSSTTRDHHAFVLRNRLEMQPNAPERP